MDTDTLLNVLQDKKVKRLEEQLEQERAAVLSAAGVIGSMDDALYMARRVMTLGERINYLRTGRNWSLSELGRASGGISKGHLSEIERGNMQPGIEVVTKIAHAFDISPAVLLGGQDSELTPDEQALIDAYRAGDKLGAIRIVMAKD